MKVRDTLQTLTNGVDLVLPPWLAFPGIDSLDMFWRMGSGDSYLDTLYEYFKNSDKEKYIEQFPPPKDGWVDFYRE